MQRHSPPGLPPYWTFDLLRDVPGLLHGVFTRQGPDGAGDFNLSFGNGDAETALKNLRAAEAALGLGQASFLNQAHGDGLLELAPGESCSPQSPEEMREGFDGLIGGRGQALMVKLADCQGIVLYAPDSESLAVVHSGWRGSRLDIAGKAVRELARLRGAVPEKMLACVSPSIGPCCMEFRGWREELPESLWGYRDPRGDRFDFWSLTRDQLLAAGLAPENVEIAGICTRCTGEFFSHRRGDRGRFAVMAGLGRA
ncbi:MAG: polyphenol oxidase family protein [Deltaproteobacteria bacterium]|jgi:copper oxidase (laccase) domain-containing protein|nr:polyphenol oxidase family protein [Deltaproteobacteria bacterium]